MLFFYTTASGNPLHFRSNFLERIKIIILSIDDVIRDEKPKWDSNKEAVKILASLLGKLINMNILQVKKQYLLIIVEL